VSDILDLIVASVRDRLAQNKPAEDLAARAWASTGERRSLRASLAAPGVRVIAECKRRSPSRGVLRDPLAVPELVAAYHSAGAAAISVVTEPEHFAGDPAWLAQARAAAPLPVLQKDFIVSDRQLFEAVLLGADAVLLIVRILPGGHLGELHALAAELGLDVVVEVHDETELSRAMGLPVPIVGINARDLASFRVDLDAAIQLARQVPAGRLAVIESGVAGREDVIRAREQGVRRFLVGEYLLRAADPGAALAELVAC
jgi:indole-3-glycerol phosphate synthase